MARNFCLLIFLACSLFGTEKFWFSYKIATENKKIVFEERNISPQMQDNDTNYKLFCRINKKIKKFQSTKHYLNENFDELLKCFYSLNIKIVNYTLIETRGVLERTFVKIVPVKFTVEFKGDFANIYKKMGQI